MQGIKQEKELRIGLCIFIRIYRWWPRVFVQYHAKSQEKFGDVASFISKLSDLKTILAEMEFISIR